MWFEIYSISALEVLLSCSQNNLDKNLASNNQSVKKGKKININSTPLIYTKGLEIHSSLQFFIQYLVCSCEVLSNMH